MLECVQHKQPDGRGQAATAAAVDIGDEGGNRCVPSPGNSRQFLPEPVFERQAGAVPPDADRSLFHLLPYDGLFRSVADKSGDDFNMAAEAELVNYLKARQAIAAGDEDCGVAGETGRIA